MSAATWRSQSLHNLINKLVSNDRVPYLDREKLEVIPKKIEMSLSNYCRD